MANHALIICKSCQLSAVREKHSDETDGTRLLKELQLLYDQWTRRNELAIETTSCLCICERPCAIAFVGTQKPTYLFGDLPPLECAADLLVASELYLDSDDGMVPAFQLPASLKPHRIARIPPAP